MVGWGSPWLLNQLRGVYTEDFFFRCVGIYFAVKKRLGFPFPAITKKGAEQYKVTMPAICPRRKGTEVMTIVAKLLKDDDEIAQRCARLLMEDFPPMCEVWSQECECRLTQQKKNFDKDEKNSKTVNRRNYFPMEDFMC